MAREGSKLRRALVWLLRIVAGIVAIPLGYFLIGVILSAVPANVAWRQPEQGITIYVRSNGIHTWIVMPKVTTGDGLAALCAAGASAESALGQCRSCRDRLRQSGLLSEHADLGRSLVQTAGLALAGSGTTLLHVEHIDRPRPDEAQRPLRLTPNQYRRLVGFIQRRFRLDSGGRPIPVLGRGYNEWDMFYEANGGYSFVLTCNEWTGRALREAGVRIGLWTPFEQSIMWRLD